MLTSYRGDRSRSIAARAESLKGHRNWLNGLPHKISPRISPGKGIRAGWPRAPSCHVLRGSMNKRLGPFGCTETCGANATETGPGIAPAESVDLAMESAI